MALRSAGSDASEIAKHLVPLVATLVLAGRVDIPLNPTLFAYLAIVLARSGIASFCAGVPEAKK
jgi:hypothetical protein